MGCKEKYVPFGIMEEDSGQLRLTFGSSFKTSDFIVDSLEDWWKAIPVEKQPRYPPATQGGQWPGKQR